MGVHTLYDRVFEGEGKCTHPHPPFRCKPLIISILFHILLSSLRSDMNIVAVYFFIYNGQSFANQISFLFCSCHVHTYTLCLNSRCTRIALTWSGLQDSSVLKNFNICFYHKCIDTLCYIINHNIAT